MVLPLLALPLALIASSAIMVAPYANEELKKKDIATKIDHLTASEIRSRQSTRLSQPDVGNTTIVVNEQLDNNSVTQQSWFIPALIAGAAIVAIMVLK